MTVLLFGCFIPVPWMIKLIDSMNGVCVSFIMTNFEELLAKDSYVSVHHNTIHALAINMYKVANGISPEIMSEVFNLRHTIRFLVGVIHSDFNGSGSASYLDPKIW